jgi:lipopolysaccharide transport system permease protein
MEAAVSHREERPFKRIAPSRGLSLGLAELWRFRELVWFLTLRDVQVRYKQTLFGAGWAILQPLLQTIIFTFFFGRLANIPSDGIPYPIFSFAALLPWSYFSQTVVLASQSLVGNAQLLRKVYFPRLAIPLAGVLAGLVDLSIASVVLVLFMAYYDVGLTPRVILAPLFVLVVVITALGASLWLSALNVRYRDVKHVVPFLVQFWLFATPVIYPSSMLPERFHIVYAINPMVGAIEGLRWSLLGTAPPNSIFIASSAVAIALMWSGAVFFRVSERAFADIV